nr:MFS transporter [Frigidibacter oleivorans]
MARPSTFAPLAVPDYRRLWFASQVSNLGTLIQAVGAGWLMTSLTTSETMVALVQASNSLPIMVLSLVAGALADSFDRRRILIAAQMLMLAMSVALAVAAMLGVLTPWALLTFTFLIGSGTALYNPAWQASLGDIVPRESLPSAVSLNSMSFNLARSVGPAIGGFLVALAGPPAAFAVNATSYLPNLWALFRWQRPPSRARLPREPLGQALGAGARYMAMSPNLVRVMLRAALFGFSAIAALALLPLVAREFLQGTAMTYGLLLGFFGIGAICGVAANARLRARLVNEHVVALAFAALAVGLIGLGLSRHVLTSGLALMVGGAGWVLALSLFNVSVQLSTPRWVVGRALSFYQMAAFGGMSLGSWCWGWVAEAAGLQQALVIAAGLLLAGALLGRWLPVPEFSSLDLAPLGMFNEPELRLDLRGRSGPIMILIDYRIAPEDTDNFLAVMQVRRRIRIRDGARQWTLLRDLEQPDIWTETYHVPTWADYIRHNERRTKADLEVYEALMALHRGPGRPRVHRMIERQTVPLHDDLGPKPPPADLH